MDLTLLPKKQQEALNISKVILSKPILFNSLERKLTPIEVFNKPLLGEVYKGDFSYIGYKTVFTLVNRFLEGFAFTTKLPENQKQILTSDLLDVCRYESLEDLILFFKNARKGVYGVAKKGVDVNTIIGDWLPQYLESKSILKENLEAEEKARKTRLITSQAKSIEFYKKHNEQKKAQKKANEMMNLANEAVKEVVDKQMLEDLILSWERNIELRPFVRLLTAKRKQFKK